MRLTLSLAASLILSGSLSLQPSTSSKHLGRIAPAASMLEARSGHTATLLPDGRVLIAGGMRRNQDFYQSAEIYDPRTGKFERTATMHERRVGHIAVALRSGKVLIAGGWIGHAATDSAELYDPAAGTFQLLPARMSVPRGDARATVLKNGDVLITGGGESNSPGGVSAAEIFHADSQRFQAISPMHFARVSHTSTLLQDGRVLIAGGRGERVDAVAELFDPATGKFTETGSLITARYKHTAGLLADGRVLIAGGSDERDWRGNLDSAEIYSPSTGRFQAIPSLHDKRFKLPEAVRLDSGELLIAGGSSSAEVFDPASASFLSVDGKMADARHFMTATRLENGRVLLAGGYADSDEATAQTWIYQP